MNDVYDSLQNYGRRPVQRLHDHGILGDKTILGHCIHVNPAEIELIQNTHTMVVNNPESNMSNAVGVCPVLPLSKGKNGHIAIRTNSVELAVAELAKKGFAYDESSAKYKNGRMTVAYLKDEFGGFAVHLLQK